MDLGAYIQIEALAELAKNSGIEIPRLRGYRLMADESKISSCEIKQRMNEMDVTVCEQLCTAEPFWTPRCDFRVYNSWTDRLRDYYLDRNLSKDYRSYTGIRWDRIHGWKRKTLKCEIKKAHRKVQQTYDAWNRYAGQEGVLYIHARIGGHYWELYGGHDLEKQPWFIEKIDNYFDSTYCDIYARLH